MSAVIRSNEKRILILCSIGHVLEEHALTGKNAATSRILSELTLRESGDRFDRLAEQCRGAGHNVAYENLIQSKAQGDLFDVATQELRP